MAVQERRVSIANRTKPDANSLEVSQSAFEAIGLKPRSRLSRYRTEIVLSAVFLAVGIRVGYFLSIHNGRWVEALSAIFAMIALGAGYLQWRAGRHEGSFDKYYDKLDVANRRFDTWNMQMYKDAPDKLEDHLYNMTVFAELDNVEYVVEKYKMGYVRQELAERALRTLASRCHESQRFQHRALHWINKAEGYEETTRKIVNHICNKGGVPSSPVQVSARGEEPSEHTPRENTL